MHPFRNTVIQFTRSGFKMICLVLCCNCVTPVEIPVDKVGGQLVVSGQVSNIQEQNIVQLGLSADTDRLPYPLSGATIALIDDAGGYSYYEEDYSNPGSYLLANTAGIPGRVYYIQITTPNGAVFESVAERMPDAAGQITTHHEFLLEEYTDLEGTVLTDQFIKIYTNSSLPTNIGESYLKWGIEEAFLLTPTDFPDPFGVVPPPCFIVQNADPQRIPLFNSESLNTQTIDNLLIGSRIVDWSFLEKHYFTTYQTSMTKEAYEYWEKVNILANQVGSIFDTPPAAINGNVFGVSNSSIKALGYFQAVNQTYDRFYTHVNDLPFQLTSTTCTYGPYRSYESYPYRCLDCPSVRNSSYKRPSWF
ncbi:MAG: DUF4249 domain-containing protein [Cyclobacteriaceae bacterium]|nr:DUF4249 domain-containing protein [Cyclobacteriaceae bacterium]